MVLKPERLRAALSRWPDLAVVVRDECPSTNRIVAEIMTADDAPRAALAVTDFQSAGEGRRGRSWVGPRGTDILATLGARLSEFGYELDLRFPLMACALIARGVERESTIRLHTKWPNDLVSRERKKVGGILIRNRPSHLAIGLGINVNSAPDDYPEDIRWRVTTLSAVAGRELDRTQLLGEIANELLGHIAGEHPLDGEELMDEWLSRSLTIGEPLLLHRGEELVEVTPLRLVRETGELVVRESDGSESVLNSADTIEY